MFATCKCVHGGLNLRYFPLECNVLNGLNLICFPLELSVLGGHNLRGNHSYVRKFLNTIMVLTDLRAKGKVINGFY